MLLHRLVIQNLPRLVYLSFHILTSYYVLKKHPGLATICQKQVSKRMLENVL